MSLDVINSSASEITAAIKNRTTSAVAVVREALAYVDKSHSQINAFTAVTATRALAEAKAVDDSIEKGRDPGPLAGVPYAVKNLFDLEGVVTVAGSKISRSDPPATQDATAVERLKRAGAICLGALNMGEYAYDFVTENAHDGSTRNPRDLARSAGGSSGGCGAAVAAGAVSISIGSDTNGSIRVPSSFCGIWGLKPTYGRLSRAGAFPFVNSLDHIGPFSRTVFDLANVYDTLQGPDRRDPACSERLAEPTLSTLDDGTTGLRIGILDGYFSQRASTEAHAAVAKVASVLKAHQRVELPDAARARAAAYIVSASEGGNLHLSRLKNRAMDFDPNARDRFIAGALTPATWYIQAQRFRSWWREQMKIVFEKVDVLIAPATPVSATLLGQQTMILDGEEMHVRANLGLFTQPISFAGLPVVAAPVQGSTLPIGVQLIAAPWREDLLLRVARSLEVSGVCSAPAVNLN